MTIIEAILNSEETKLLFAVQGDERQAMKVVMDRLLSMDSQPAIRSLRVVGWAQVLVAQ